MPSITVGQRQYPGMPNANENHNTNLQLKNAIFSMKVRKINTMERSQVLSKMPTQRINTYVMLMGRLSTSCRD